MVNKKGWDEFRSTGLVLIINQLLHVFGWAIVFELDKDGEVKNVYPARVKFRGFKHDCAAHSHKQVTQYLKDNINDLYDETH